MRKKAGPVPTFASEAEEQRFWECHDTTDHVDWEPGRARAAAEPSTLDDIDLASPAGEPARADQDRRPQARRSLPGADQDLARREARFALTALGGRGGERSREHCRRAARAYLRRWPPVDHWSGGPTTFMLCSISSARSAFSSAPFHFMK